MICRDIARPNGLVGVGLLVLAIANATRALMPAPGSRGTLTEALIDGGLGILFGVGLGCLLVAVRNARRRRRR